jgi:NNP family nitrate/nitrite transporter-like MFS transporter
MFPLVSLATAVPVLFLGFVGHRSLPGLLLGGFFLGIGGTAFAIGVPFVNAWFPAERRGLAVGIFGAGMGGTAISALTTVKLADAHGIQAPFLLTAAALAAFAMLSAALLREAPGRVRAVGSTMHRLRGALALPVTWQASGLYALAFGGYVAFSVYLPTYLKTAYGLTPADAATKMAGFVLLAVVMRPLGGWLSDHLHPGLVLAGAFGLIAVSASVQSMTPGLTWTGTAAFLVMAAALGAGTGAVFALVAALSPKNAVGAVTGVVGAAGGLGGFVPPLLMGSIYGASGSYSLGLLLMAAAAGAALMFSGSLARR